MKFRYFTLTDNPPAYGPDRRDPNRFLLDVVEECVEAEAMGYHSARVPEHHFGRFGVLPSPTMFLAHVAVRTKRLKLGPATVVLPINHPLRMVEEFNLLDLLSDGRAVFSAAMLFGSVQEAARESKRMAREAGHPDPKVMCSYFVSVAKSRDEADRARERLLHYLHSILPVFPSDRRTAPPHIAYFVDIVERLRAMKADQVSDRSIVTGDVEHCIEVLKRCAEGGISEVILYFNFGELGHRDTLKAMERFAREVMPHFAERTQSVAAGR